MSSESNAAGIVDGAVLNVQRSSADTGLMTGWSSTVHLMWTRERQTYLLSRCYPTILRHQRSCGVHQNEIHVRLGSLGLQGGGVAWVLIGPTTMFMEFRVSIPVRLEVVGAEEDVAHLSATFFP